MVWVEIGSTLLTFKVTSQTWKCGTYTPYSLWVGSIWPPTVDAARFFLDLDPELLGAMG